MSSYEKIMKALKGKKTGLTLPELVEKTGLNENTARRALSELHIWPAEQTQRKCKVSGKVRTAYVAA